jgi:hypothetical protein
MPRSSITGSYGSLIFNFLRHLHTAFLMLVLICIPTNSVEALLFRHILASICCWNALEYVLLTGVRWNFSGVLICISFIAREVNPSSWIYWPFVCLPFRIACLNHLFISSLGCWFFGGWVFRSVDSGYYSLIMWITGKDFLPFCRQSLESTDCFFCCAEVF